MADNIELSETEKKQCRNMFESFDKYGYGQISIPDFLKVSQIMRVPITEEELEESLNKVSHTKKSHITYEDFETIFKGLRKKIQEMQSSSPFLDIFISMGGNPDRTGHISTGVLVKLLTEDFQMPVDVVKLLNELDQDRSGTVDFEEFKFLLR